ncbi:hypothetical protein CUT44_12515 [Streptomyces carminius]|uniref:Uncharacterized protein n=1 Tax=Streptomyces carminius TaxID=2665496 RepID=A0A2M8LZV8_9ACTN|nr:hypothetical protein [Streptomyces carminius]PJE97497.1 hypothetical protein CUT44_12515 [Streptomyces carminius]
MSARPTRPTRPARRWPAAEWWAPLVKDLAAVQRGSAALGLVVRRVALAGPRPLVEAAWPDGTAATVAPDPEAGVPALLAALGARGPVAPPPGNHDRIHWAPGRDAPPLLAYAWLLDELGSTSDAWYAYTPTPVELLEITADGTEAVGVVVGRPGRRDAVRVRAALAHRGETGGFGYAVVERAVAAGDEDGEPCPDSVAGLPVRQVTLSGG